MTEKDKQIQDLKRKVAGLEEELNEIVMATGSCRYCKNLDGDCIPFSDGCKPEWRGVK